MLINIRIFVYVRSSSNRVLPHNSNTVSNPVSVQNPRISRREIALVKQMAYMFLVFVIGWSPIYIITVVGLFASVNTLAYHLAVVLCEASVLTIVFNLFKINRDLRQYLWDKVRFCLVRR